jgi:hypothetical protein
MRRAIFILSQKGGSGKSTFSRALLDHLRLLRGLPVAAYDADGQVGQLLQHYGRRDNRGELVARQDALSGVDSFDLRDSTQRGFVLDALDMPAGTLLFDFPAGCLGELGKVVGGGHGLAPLLDVYEAEGVAVTAAVVISNVQASTANVQAVIEAFGGRADIVAVKNLFYGKPEDFLFFEGFTAADGRFYGGQARQLLDRQGGEIFALPALPGREYALCDLYSLGFSEAVHHPALRRSERAAVSLFLREFGREADRLGRLFGCESAG